jgi:hypothetical protein
MRASSTGPQSSAAAVNISADVMTAGKRRSAAGPALTGGFFFAQKKRPQLGGELGPSCQGCCAKRDSALKNLISETFPRTITRLGY